MAKTDWQKNKLKGQVKCIIETVYDIKVKNGKINNKRQIGFSNRMTFNDIGYIIEEYLNNGEGSLVARAVYEYNSEGDNVSIFWLDPAGVLESYYINQYNHHNKVECKYLGPNGRMITRTKYMYDGKNREIERYDYRYNNELNSKTFYKYDNCDNILERISFTPGEEIIEKETLEYDGNSYEIFSTISKPRENLAFKTHYKYELDASQNWVLKLGNL